MDCEKLDQVISYLERVNIDEIIKILKEFRNYVRQVEWNRKTLTEKLDTELPLFDNEDTIDVDDCNHYPGITKEDLDRELEECMNQ